MYNREHHKGVTGVHKMPVVSLQILIFRVCSIVTSLISILITRGYGGTSMRGIGTHGLYKSLNVLR